FKNPSFIAKNVMFFMQYGFFGFYTNYLPTWGQGVMGATALVGGMVLIPSAIMLVIGTRNVNHLIQKVGEKRTIYIGFAIMVLGALFLFSLPEHASILMLFVATAILGTAFGIVNITLQVAVQESVAKHLIGAATAVNALLRTMGTTLVLSGLSIALNRTFTDSTAHNPKLTTTLLNQISDAQALKNIPTALVAPLRHTLFNGMHLLALISGLLLFIALFVNWLDPWKKGLE
ncbi:MAG: MFS transporter, partial [Lactococcus cremoris]